MVFIFLLFPCFGFGFTEAEIDLLESTKEKDLASSPWTAQFDFALQRNLLLPSRLSNSQEQGQKKNSEGKSRLSDLLNPYKDTSLLDLSNLYYTLNLSLNYSLRNIAEDLQYEWLKTTKLFLNSSFNSAFKPSKLKVKGYGYIDYIQYALGDIIGGFKVPAYSRGNFLSSLSFSFIAFPLSRYSREAGLWTTVDGTVNFLYFLKKTPEWDVALSSSHNLAYSHYEKDSADPRGYNNNVPYDTSQSFSLIFKQSLNKYFPFSTRLSSSHYFGINTYRTRLYDLTLGCSSSWKVKDSLYFNFSISWKDRIFVYNPYHKKVRKREPVRFNLAHTFFVIGGTYFF